MARALKYADAKTSVFWDVDDFPLSSRVSYHETIRSALEKNGYVGEVSIMAYGEKKPDNLDGEITFIRKSNKCLRLIQMLFDIHLWGVDRYDRPSRYNLLLIAKNITQETEISSILGGMTADSSRFNVVFVLPDVPEGVSVPKAYSVWYWGSLLKGETPIDMPKISGFVQIGKTKEGDTPCPMCDGKPHGTLENLLQSVDEIKEGRLKESLIANADQAKLSMQEALLRTDLPDYMVPFETRDLAFKKPEDNGEKWRSLLVAIGAYAEGFSADPVIRKTFTLWESLEANS